VKHPTRALLLAAALALGSALAYLPALRSGWAFDDANLVQPSPALEDLAGLRSAVSTDLYRQASPRLEASPYWRPLALASFWLDTRLGDAPGALHLGNVLLHALAAALLAFVLLRRVEGAGGGGRLGLAAAGLAAAWWALHAQNVEPVAWISGRYDVLCGLALLGLLALPWRPGWGRAALHGLVFLAGLLSKDGFGVFVVVVAAMDWAERRRPREAAPRWAAVAVALAGWWSARALVGVPRFDAPGAGIVLGILLRYLDVVRIYALRAVWPAPLTIDHPYPPAGLGDLLAGAVLILALVAAAVWRRRLAVPVALFLGGLAPAAAAVARFGEVPERYFYVPSLGLALLLGELIAAGLAAPRPSVKLLAPVAAGALALLGLVRVERRLPDWRGDETLFAAALRVDPEDAQANQALGIEAGRRGDWAEARRRLEVAQRSDPRSGRVAGALAWALAQTGDLPGALAAAARATEVAPYLPDGWYFLALARHRSGDHVGELEAIDRLLQLSPGFPGAQRGRAVAACEVSGRTDCLQPAGARP
jgi:tetratricopeptide (TPR) repeat protein